MIVTSKVISQTAASGDVTSTAAVPFNDLADIAGFPFTYDLDSRAPISQIDFTGFDRVKGMRVHYRKADGTAAIVVHGRAPPSGAPKLELFENDVIVNVVAVSGAFNDITSVLQLNFVVLDQETGKLRYEGPFCDSATDEQPFFAAGPIVAFAGKATAQHVSAISFFSSSNT